MPFITGLPLNIFTNSKKSSTVFPRAHVDTSTVSNRFGVPNADDDDPFGVFALEEAGFEIKEAGTKSRPSSEQFEYRPSPTSPLFPAYRRSMQNLDRISWEHRRNSRRNSRRSNKSVDMGTQTCNFPSSPIEEPAPLYHSPRRMDSGNSDSSISPVTPTTEEWERRQNPPRRLIRNSIFSVKEEDEEIFEEEPEAVIEDIQGVHIVSHAVTSPVSPIHPRLVNIPRRPAPILPARNPLRTRRPRFISADEAETQEVDFTDDSSSVYSISPTRSEFDSQGPASPNPWSEQTSLQDDDSIRRKGGDIPDDDDVNPPNYTDSGVQMDINESKEQSQEPQRVASMEQDVQVEELKTEEESLEKMTEAVNHALAEKISSPRLRPMAEDLLNPDNVAETIDIKDDASVYDDDVPQSKDEDEFHSAQPSRTQTPANTMPELSTIGLAS